MQAEVKDAYWAIFETGSLKTAPGPRLVEIIDTRISELAGKYQALYPAAAKCLTADREGLTAYLRFPAGHHHRTRHSKRTFGDYAAPVVMPRWVRGSLYVAGLAAG